MPEPVKNETKEKYIARFMDSEEAKKDFPDKAQRYAVALSKWKNKGKKKISGSLGNLEMQASIFDAEVTEEIVNEYGLSLSDIDQNGYHLIEGELMYLDEPCSPVVEGELKDKVKQFTFDSSNADEFLASLKNKPIHINSNFDGHYDIAGDGSKDHTVVGSFLGGRIETKEDGSKVVKFLGGLFDKSLPKEVAEIKARKKDLGASFELNPTEIEIDEDSMIANVKSWVYKGAAILQKTFAAFPETSLLIAQRGDIDIMAKKDLEAPMSSMKKMLKIMGDMDINYEDMDELMKSMSGDDIAKINKIMKMVNNSLWFIAGKNQAREDGTQMEDKTYTQAELDSKIAEAKEEVKTSIENTAKAEEATAVKEAEVTEIKAQLATKDATIVSLSDKVKALETEKDEATITAAVNTWWNDNSKFYEEKDKETILSARRAVLKKEATPEQIDSMISARKAEGIAKKTVDLLASGPLKEGTDIDILHGINSRDGWKRK